MKTEKYFLSVWNYDVCMFKGLELPKTKINEILRQLNISVELHDDEFPTELITETTEINSAIKTVYSYKNCGCYVDILHYKCKEGYQFKK